MKYGHIPLFPLRRLLPFLLSLLLGVPLASASFSDVPSDHPFKEAIDYVQSEGIVSGYKDGTFKPNAEINRAEFTKIIIGSAFKVDGSGKTEKLFRDVQGSEWFAPYVEKAVDEEIILGYGDAKLQDQTARPFYPTFKITYAEAGKILVLALGLRAGKEESGEWWQPYLTALDEKDALPNGWRPTKTVTRGEMAEMIYRLKTGKESSKSYSYSAPVQAKKVNLPILVYHHVRPQEDWGESTWSWKMTVSPSIFEKQMKWLMERGYTSIDLDTMVSILNGGIAGPEKPVVITFDDNNLNAYEVGAPIMEKYGHTAVFYQIGKHLENHAAIDTERTKDLFDRGFDIQAHTMTHRVLTALSVEEIDWEFRESRRMLEEIIGRPVKHVAYPGTSHNATVRERAKLAGFVTGTLMDPRRVTDGFDMFKLPRIMMTDTTSLEKVLP